MAEGRVGSATGPDLVSAVAHELRSPIAAIRAVTTSLRRADLDDATRVRLLDVLDRAGAQLASLVDDLLLAGRLGTELLPVSLEPCDLEELVGELVGDYRATRGSDVALSGAAGAPRVLADPKRLRQVLANLVENALAHSPAGRPVVVSVDRDAHWVRIAVADEGPGIPAAERERVFEPYRRLQEERPGSGLGLSIARTLTERMGGRLTAGERPGGGALLTVELRPAG
jgi:two-component system sensor histidine kinase KdpD